jgi:Flp pilus assembly pilin Flp
MKTTLCQLWSNDDGQDLIEYTLLLAFICLSTAALMTKAGASVGTIWTAANSTLSNAAAKVSGS